MQQDDTQDEDDDAQYTDPNDEQADLVLVDVKLGPGVSCFEILKPSNFCLIENEEVERLL